MGQGRIPRRPTLSERGATVSHAEQLYDWWHDQRWHRARVLSARRSVEHLEDCLARARARLVELERMRWPY